MKNYNLVLNDNQKAYVYEWSDFEGEIKGVIQLIHGSCEYLKRYDYFAKEMNKQNYVVIGIDLRGHGMTAELNNEKLGYFKTNNGWNTLVDDQNTLNEYIKKTWPNSSIILMGHSMGSFLARTYAFTFKDKFDKLILSGTAEYSKLLIQPSILISKVLQFLQGSKKVSKFIYNLSYKKLNKNSKIKNSWICKDVEIVKEFNEDPLCGQIFTTSAFKDIFEGINKNIKIENINKMNKNNPILIISGQEDIVSENTKSIKKLIKKLILLGYNYKTIFYENMYHEILNEKDKELVINDIIKFIND